jgi:hypothetical protein
MSLLESRRLRVCCSERYNWGETHVASRSWLGNERKLRTNPDPIRLRTSFKKRHQGLPGEAAAQRLRRTPRKWAARRSASGALMRYLETPSILRTGTQFCTIHWHRLGANCIYQSDNVRTASGAKCTHSPNNNKYYSRLRIHFYRAPIGTTSG